jgi:hypothetical protein
VNAVMKYLVQSNSVKRSSDYTTCGLSSSVRLHRMNSLDLTGTSGSVLG